MHTFSRVYAHRGTTRDFKSIKKNSLWDPCSADTHTQA